MHQPRKRFGQHFLCDQAVIHNIITALSPQPGQHLVEIGPGQGALTSPLLKLVKHLEVIELDRDLIAELNARNRQGCDLVVHAADVLDFDFAAIQKDKRMRVFGNLPYNISTPLLFHLLEYTSIIDDMLFMLQKEVALRLAAQPNSKDYSRLSVMVQYHCEVDVLFHVSPQAFYPPPQVQSSIVQLKPYRELPYRAKDFNLFADVVKHAFGQRRKTLRNSLKELLDDDAWAHIPIRSDLRPENLSVEQFVELCNAVGEKQ